MRKQTQSQETPPCVYAASGVYVFCVLAMMLLVVTGGNILLVLGVFAFGVVTIAILVALFKGRNLTQWLTRR